MMIISYGALIIWRLGNMTKPPASYGSQVKLKVLKPETAPSDEALVKLAAAARNRPMETRSDPTIIYLHPDGKYELKRYALARGSKVKVHDLLIEAVQEWAERHGIVAPFRVPLEKLRKL